MFTPTMFHMSCVKCQVSGVRCQIFFVCYKVGELVGGGSVNNGAYPSSLYSHLCFNITEEGHMIVQE